MKRYFSWVVDRGLVSREPARAVKRHLQEEYSDGAARLLDAVGTEIDNLTQ